jgi:RNase P subunit RPR2
MTEPQPQEQHTHDGIVVMCENCGAIIRIANVGAFLLGLHLAENCPETEQLRAPT